MYPHLQQYSFKVTPGMTESTFGEPANSGIRRNFKDVSREIQQLADDKKNMMSCDLIFTLYLRELSQIVNENYYSIL